MKLSIIIPICNTDYPPAHYTGSCIGSIKFFTDCNNYEIIVVDNGSTVELGGVIWKDIADVYIKNETNLGVAKAWNQGIKAAKGRYIAILNSDIQVFGFWDWLMMDSLKHVDLVMSTPMYDQPYGRAKESEVIRHSFEDNPDKYLKDFADFSCFMLKKETIDKIGLFDEAYGLGYGEDVDYRLRMEKEGLVCKSDARVAIHHVGMATGHTLGNQGVDLGAEMDRNKKYTKEKHKLDEYGLPEFKRVDKDGVVIKKEQKVNSEGGYPVRTKKTADKVYYILGDLSYWVSNPETLYMLGFGFNDVRLMDHEEFVKLEPQDKLDLKELYLDSQPKPVAKEVDPVLGHAVNAKI